jgi:hypothetical protein
MSEAVLEKESCDSCGVDRREGTQFCYNCGASLADENATPRTDIGPHADSVTKGPEIGNGHSPDGSDKLAAAATKRKRARVSHRKTAEYVWEREGYDRSRMALVTAVVIFVLAFVVVLLMLDW